MSIKQRFLSFFILLAVVSQSVAAVYATCQSVDMDEDSLPMAHMDHSMHAMQAQGDPAGSDKPCCGDADCSMMQCGILFTAIVDRDFFRSTALPTVPVINSIIGLPVSHSASLFRPPISS